LAVDLFPISLQVSQVEAEAGMEIGCAGFGNIKVTRTFAIPGDQVYLPV
jgi:hypothetical protein